MSAAAPQREPLCLVAAMSSNRVIGRDGDLPWHEPEDLAHFKRTTLGHVVIMGRKTWQALGRPLPKRRNLVVTRDRTFQAKGAEVFHDVAEAIRSARRDDAEPMIIGGGELYRATLPLATRLELTEVECEVDGDATFPDLDAGWDLASERRSGRLVFRSYRR